MKLVAEQMDPHKDHWVQTCYAMENVVFQANNRFTKFWCHVDGTNSLIQCRNIIVFSCNYSTNGFSVQWMHMILQLCNECMIVRAHQIELPTGNARLSV